MIEHRLTDEAGVGQPSIGPASPLQTQAVAAPQTLPAVPDILIVGGGVAGLEVATTLGKTLGRRGLANVTLIEKGRTHLWKPLLHAVAAGSMSPSEEELNYLAQAHWRHFKYKFGEMVGLDRAKKEVQLGATYDDEGRLITPIRSVTYDILVIAVGSVTNDFGTAGVADYAIPLETAEQAVRFNRRLVNACIRANAQIEDVRAGQLHVAIIGAGATGTELAAELNRTAREIVAHGLDHVNAEKDIKIILIEAASRLLPALPETISEAARRLLVDIGVEVYTDARVSEVTPEGVRLAKGDFIQSELVVWSAGVKAPDFLQEIGGLETNRINQLVVTPRLETTLDPNIFAIGDCAQCPQMGSDKPVPPRAQAAHQQASHLVKQLRRRLKGEPLKPFVYRDFGSLVSLGGYSTVGSLMGFLVGRNLFIEGYFARMMYRSLHFMHEATLFGFAKATVRSVGRRISRYAEPTVKLH